MPPPKPEERYCTKCQPRHRVYMHYMLSKGGWHVRFLEEDLKTPLRRRFTFADVEKVRELAQRGSAERSLADEQGMEHGISTGRGGLWLRLTEDQYRRLTA